MLIHDFISVTDDRHYEEKSIIFVPEFVNIMTAGGIFETEETFRAVMTKRGWADYDIRYAKVVVVPEFLSEMVAFRLQRGLYY